MKKKSTSTMSKFSPNMVPNSFDRSFSFANFHVKKHTQSKGLPSWKEIDGQHKLWMMYHQHTRRWFVDFSIWHINTSNFSCLHSLFDELVEYFFNNNKEVRSHKASLPYTLTNGKVCRGLSIEVHCNTSIGE
jgi:hypothetical protein